MAGSNRIKIIGDEACAGPENAGGTAEVVLPRKMKCSLGFQALPIYNALC